MTAYDELRAKVEANPGPLIEWAIGQWAYLGSLEEWDMDDNRQCTESLVGQAEIYSDHNAGDQDDDDLAYWDAMHTEIYGWSLRE